MDSYRSHLKGIRNRMLLMVDEQKILNIERTVRNIESIVKNHFEERIVITDNG